MNYRNSFSIKCITILLLALICLPLSGEKRAKEITMAELTNPDSPYYVPCPYPEDQEEFMENLKYYADKNCNGLSRLLVKKDAGFIDVARAKFWVLFSHFKMVKILKMKNRIQSHHHSYCWLIFVLGRSRHHVIRKIAMSAEGIVSGMCENSEESIKEVSSNEYRAILYNYRTILGYRNAISALWHALGRRLTRSEIEKVERVARYSSISNIVQPVFEIRLKNGKLYVYSEMTDMVYLVEKRIPYKPAQNEGTRKELETFNNSFAGTSIHDRISDELLILKEMPAI